MERPLLQTVNGQKDIYQMELFCKKTMSVKEYKKLVDLDEPKIKDLNINERNIFEGLSVKA